MTLAVDPDAVRPTVERPARRPPRSLVSRLRRLARPLTRRVSRLLPRGLYTRSILIVVTPIVLLQGAVAYIFLERHWQLVTDRLSRAVVRDISAVIQMAELYPEGGDKPRLKQIAKRSFDFDVDILPPGAMPPDWRPGVFSLLDRTLSRAITNQIALPFWLDSDRSKDYIEVRIRLDDDRVLRVLARRNNAYASNSHIFLVWMVGTAAVLITIALLFLRNQIRPILDLSKEAERFGRGQPSRELRPRGATEVRFAIRSFLAMRERIERQIVQRTTMLSGVSHDLRTILTRFRLELALLQGATTTEALQGDVDEMSRILEDYLTFARGEAAERSQAIDLPTLLDAVAETAARDGHLLNVRHAGPPTVEVRPIGFRRCIDNLVGNAAKFADRIDIGATVADGWLTLTIDDDGPGIPEAERSAVFRPFHSSASGGTGLGLAIARDIVLTHGGDIRLETSPLGGLRVVVEIPA